MGILLPVLPSPLLPAAFNLLKTFLGIGLLTFPYGFSIVGLGPGIVLTILIIYLVRISMVLLIRTQFLIQTKKSTVASSGTSSILPTVHRKPKHHPPTTGTTLSFPQIVQNVFDIIVSSSSSSSAVRISSSSSFIVASNRMHNTFRHVFQYLTTGILIIGQLGTCIGYLVFIHTNLYTIAHSLFFGNNDTSSSSLNQTSSTVEYGYGFLISETSLKNILMIIIVILLLPVIVFMKNMKSLYVISIIGILTLITGFSILLYTCPFLVLSIEKLRSSSTGPTGTNVSGFNVFYSSPSGESFWSYHSTGLWTFLGIACFAAEGIVNIPSIMSTLSSTHPHPGNHTSLSSSSSSISNGSLPSTVKISPKRLSLIRSSIENYDASTSGTIIGNNALSSSSSSTVHDTSTLDTTRSTGSSSPQQHTGPANMLIVLDYVLIWVTLILILGGWFGWLCLGPEPPSILTLGLSSLSFTNIIIKVNFVVYILCTYPLQLYPVIEIMEEYFIVSTDQSDSTKDTAILEDDKLTVKGSRLRRILLRLLIVVFTCSVALTVHTFEQIISIIGWLSFGILSFIIPPLLYPLLLLHTYSLDQLHRNIHNDEWSLYRQSIEGSWQNTKVKNNIVTYTNKNNSGKIIDDNNNSSHGTNEYSITPSVSFHHPAETDRLTGDDKDDVTRRSVRCSSLLPPYLIHNIRTYAWYYELAGLLIYCIGGIGITIQGLIGNF